MASLAHAYAWKASGRIIKYIPTHLRTWGLFASKMCDEIALQCNVIMENVASRGKFFATVLCHTEGDDLVAKKMLKLYPYRDLE